ncbi:DUF4184 family protein [Sphaerisporangium sp. NBC_01403]|uniref:DUF4184 family protein n=1 Tax=Sphaerisporangium sp. NBC_01403 TaxID=2903599 RepID=UPI00324B5F80
MPLTLSHAAAVLPLRRRLPLAALVVGAMVPDLPYYVPLPVSAGSTHGWQGAVLVDLPAGAALLVLFELVLRTPLTALAPEGLRARLPGPAPSAPSGPAPSGRAPYGRGVTVAAALLAGVATHLLWDAFTHVDGFAVVHWQAMRVPVAGVHRVFNVVMYVSSLGGLAVLAGRIATWYRRAPVRPGRWPAAAPRERALVLVAATAAATAGAVLGSGGAPSLYDLVRSVLLGAMDGCAAILACHAIVWHALGWSRRARGHDVPS